MMGHINKTLLPLVAVLLLSTVATTFGQGTGSLMVNPKRIVFEANKRNDVVTLFNNSDDTTTYAISWRHYEMQQNGDFKDVDTVKTDVKFADSIIRFFPREVTLAPHISQTVRLQFLKPKDLPAGEYRSHLYFRAVEKAKSLETQLSDTAKTISLQLRAIFGLAIPVIVRFETTPSVVTLNNITVSAPDTAGKAIVSVDVNRAGNESAYGTLNFTYKDNGGKETPLTLAKGVGIYTPLSMRRCSLQFKVPPGVSLTSGSIHVEFESLTGGTKETILASADKPLSK